MSELSLDFFVFGLYILRERKTSIAFLSERNLIGLGLF